MRADEERDPCSKADELLLYRLLARHGFDPVGFQNSATSSDLGFYAERSYSLTRPPTMGRRLIRSWERSAMG